MLIDWFTVIAQAINFLVLVWLLKHFLYKPILDAIDAREKQIAETLAEAAETKDAAEKERDEFELKNKQFNEDRAKLVLKMKEEINVKRQELLDHAHESAEAIGVRRLQAFQREQKAFEDELTRQTQDRVFAISRKTLRDLADTSLEERITEVFVRRLHEMNGNSKQELAEALAVSSEPARIRSTFDLPEAQQNKIRHAINEFSAAKVSVRFETVPDAIGGIELTASGRKIAWSIDEYLTSMQRSIAELMKLKEKNVEGKNERESD